MLITSQVNGRLAQPANHWDRLAIVARERASEQSDKASAAQDMVTADLHLEQRAYLVRLAEVYEMRAKGDSSPDM